LEKSRWELEGVAGRGSGRGSSQKKEPLSWWAEKQSILKLLMTEVITDPKFTSDES
jgi:hypothetical protein